MGAPLEAFAELLAQEESRIDLARACLLIAQDAYPDLQVERWIGEIESHAARLRATLPATLSAEDRVIALNEFLFGELGFRGNTGEYYDPRNSYLNDVLERRTGIPITLSIVYMELGRRIGLALQGVSFPGHFLVRLRLRGGTLVLDPFAGGAPQSLDELRERLHRVVPRPELPVEEFLEPASPRQILARVLRNLKAIFRHLEQPERQLEVLNRILLVLPDASADLRERGLVYQKLECYRAALQDLTQYSEREPDAPDRDEVRARLMVLSSLCSRLN